MILFSNKSTYDYRMKLIFSLCLSQAFFLLGTSPALAVLEEPSTTHYQSSYEATVRQILKLAEQGDSQAQASLADMYRKGKGVTQSYVKAYIWYRKAAEQGNPKAQNNLGFLYQSGKGVSQDYSEALRWYRESAKQDNPDAWNNLGFMYGNGLGVPQDYDEAIRWYRKSAEQGISEAELNIGNMYIKGEGVPRDYAEASRWYRKAAERGDPKAQNNLGFSYQSGKGVSQDYSEALRWYRKAAEQGHATAQANLGVMYGTGRGVSKDYVEAYKWLTLAMRQLDDPSKIVDVIDAIKRKMSDKQIADAEKMVKEWRQKSESENYEPMITYGEDEQRKKSIMFWDAVLAGLKVLTYWQTYLAGLGYLAIFFLPMLIAGMVMEESRGIGLAGCLGVLLLPVLQVAAMVIFVLTLAPIILGLGEDAAWSLPWKILAVAPGPFFEFVGVLVLIAIGLAFIPILGQLHSLQVLVLGAITLMFFSELLDIAYPGIVKGRADFIPGFWFSIGLLIIGGVMSWISMMVLAFLATALEWVGDGIGLLMFPIGSVLGFIPVFMYGAWLGAQISG